MSTLRIAVVSNLYPPAVIGGAERSVARTVEELIRLGHEVHVMTLRSRERSSEVGPGPAITEVDDRLPYYAFDGASRAVTSRAIWHICESFGSIADQFRDHLVEISPDVVWTNGLASFGCSPWRACKALGLPVVHTVRDYYSLCARSTLYRGDSNCLSRCFGCQILRVPHRREADGVAHVVGASQSVLDVHSSFRMFDGSSMSVIPNPVDTGVVGSNTRVLPGGNVRYGFLGQLTREKGVIDAVRAFLARSSNVGSLTIAGAGEPTFLAEVQAAAASDSRIRLLGHTPQEALFAEIDVLLVPSRWREPFGRVVIEAAASGVPSVVTELGGPAELVAKYGCGWISDSARPDKLAMLLDAIDGGEVGWPSAGAFESAVAACKPALVASAYVEVFRRVVNHCI